MKVAFVLNSLGVGGSERKVIRIANELVNRGLSIHILYLGGEECLKEQIDHKVHLVNIKFDVNSVKACNSVVYRYLESQEISTVFTVNMYPLLFILLSKFKMRKRLNWVSLINTTHFETLKKELQMLVYRPLLSLTTANVFGAKNQLDIWRNKYLLGKSERSKVLHNGVDTNKFKATTELSESATKIKSEFELGRYECVFISVAQLRIEKGHKEIIDAAYQAKKAGHNLSFLFVGKGTESYEEELKEYAKQKGVRQNIIFIGQVSDPRPYLIAADAFILASDSETFSNAALEAMSLGLPAILSDVGGAREMVKSGVNGFLFDKTNKEGLISAIKDFLTCDRETLSSNAVARIRSEFTFEIMVENYLALANGEHI